ncbi:MAG: EamA family transporter [Acetobacteraceae bacterium]|nr:EamA family transporter [Acetobacteraceae bacterium]
MSKPVVQAALGEGVAAAVLAILLSPAVLGGLAVYGCGAAMWLLVLSRLPVSAVYPLVSLAIVFVVLIGTLFLKETASWGRIGGVAIVVTGLILVSRG